MAWAQRPHTAPLVNASIRLLEGRLAASHLEGAIPHQRQADTPGAWPPQLRGRGMMTTVRPVELLTDGHRRRRT